MRALFTLLLCASCVGCRGWTTEETPVVPIRNMYNQPRYDVQERSNFFADGRTMRPEVPGTMSVEQEVDPEIATGRSLDGQSWVARVPQSVIDRNGGNEAFVTHGQNRYGIYCTP